jgi:hypothetical protein
MCCVFCVCVCVCVCLYVCGWVGVKVSSLILRTEKFRSSGNNSDLCLEVKVSNPYWNSHYPHSDMFLVYFSHSRKFLGWYFKLGYYCFLPNYFQFITHYLTHLALYSLATVIVVK